MPLLTELRKIVRLDVPFIEGAWVEFYDGLTLNDVEKTKDLSANQEDLYKSMDVLASQINDWNFYKDAQNKLPINIETIKTLPIKVVTWMFESYAKLVTPDEQEVKKKELPVA